MVKQPPTSAGDIRDTGLIPGSGTSPEGGVLATHSSTLAWRIPWTEELGGYSLQSRKKLDTTEVT